MIIKSLRIFFLIFFFLIQACQQKSDVNSDIQSINQELKILLTYPVETLDPLEILYGSDWKVSSNIFEGLVALNEKDKVVPDLAVSYSISKDRSIYTFKLKGNIYFQDSPCFSSGKGRKLNSYDVKYTFERLAKKENHFSNFQMINQIIYGIKEYNEGIITSISGIKIEDSLTISFRLVKPFSAFLKMLTSPNFFIVPKEAVNYFGNDFKYHPIGTGPFRISEFRKYEKVRLVKNENYYLKDENGKKLPYLNSICYTTIKKSENVISELFNKSTHLVSVNAKNFNKLEKRDLLSNNFKVLILDKGSNFRFWGFNFFNSYKFKNYKLLRKAIAKSFNRDLIVDKINLNDVAQTIVPSHMFYKREFTWYEYDDMYSKEFNTEIFDKDTLTILVNLETMDLVELENTLERLRVPYKRIIKPENYYENIIELKPDLFRVSMFPSYPDPIEYYSLFYSNSSNDLNLGSFKNRQYDEIYEKVLYELDDSLLSEYYLQLEKILKDEVAALYLTHQGPVYYLYSKNLMGLKFKYIKLDFRKTYFK